MSKHYKRGKFLNKKISEYSWQESTGMEFKGKFVKTLIVRGIGYRAFAINNDFLSKNRLNTDFSESLRPIYSGPDYSESQEISQVASLEFSRPNYLMVRAGHTRDLSIPMHALVSCATRKKDRKLVIASADKVLCSNLARRVHLYRQPSVYTGRGVRIKHIKPLRKAGKKDKQRGKAF